jgi:hypothetical protein
MQEPQHPSRQRLGTRGELFAKAGTVLMRPAVCQRFRERHGLRLPGQRHYLDDRLICLLPVVAGTRGIKNCGVVRAGICTIVK